jgi:hypothetical protein
MTRVGSVPLPLVYKPTLANIQENVQMLQRNSALHRIDALVSKKFGEIDSKTRGNVTGSGRRVLSSL